MKLKRKIWLGILPAFLLLGFLPLQASAAVDHLVISQIQITAGSGKTNYDFVEIYNPTSQSVDLQGYRLVKRTKEGSSDALIKSFTESLIVPSAGYFLWANSEYTEIPVTPDVTTSATLAADNSVALRQGANDSGTLIDAVGWGNAANDMVEGSVFPESPGEGQALLRKNVSEDSDDNSSDFEIGIPNPKNSGTAQGPQANPAEEQQEEPDGSTENETSQPASGNPGTSTHDYAEISKLIVINEIVANPEGADQGNEWVEFYNLGSMPLDLAGWFIDDTGETLSKNGFAVPSESILLENGYLALHLSQGSPALNNSGGDCVQLYSPDKILRQKICYQESLAEGESYARKADGSYSVTAEITKGLANNFLPNFQAPASASSANIAINELYPNPEGDQDEEFIELINLGADEVDIAGWEIADRSRRYTIERNDFSETEIGPNGFFVLPRTISKIALNNSGGETIMLYNPQGAEHASIEYEGSAAKGFSFSRTQDGDLEWSTAVTPGRKNIIETSEVLDFSEEGSEDEEIQEDDPLEIASLSDVRQLPQGSRVKVMGKASVVPGTFGDRLFYLSGSGIRVVVASGVVLPQISLGNTVTLTGVLSQSRNELQIVIGQEDILEIEKSDSLPLPHEIKTGEVGESTEGFLVKIAGTITRSAGDTFYLDDGSGEARILIMEATGINKPETKKGTSAVIVGVVTQFGDVYRVIPRMQSDIEIGAVLGIRLPRTGMGFTEITLLAVFLLILLLKFLNLAQFKKYLP